jgi:hypothetical protein
MVNKLKNCALRWSLYNSWLCFFTLLRWKSALRYRQTSEDIMVNKKIKHIDSLALLECYAAYVCRFLPTFRNSLPVPSSRVTGQDEWIGLTSLILLLPTLIQPSSVSYYSLIFNTLLLFWPFSWAPESQGIRGCFWNVYVFDSIVFWYPSTCHGLEFTAMPVHHELHRFNYV